MLVAYPTRKAQNGRGLFLQLPPYPLELNKVESQKTERRKRFRWSDALHRRFMGALFDIGLQLARPKSVFSAMQEWGFPVGLTTERIISHLQKYRNNSKKYRERFLEQFDVAFAAASQK